jgi:hypothetical protein
MNKEPTRSPLAHLPGILAAVAALVAAVSTLYVNMHNGSATPSAEASAQVAAPPATTPAPAGAAAPDVKEAAPAPMQLRLDRVLVENDGSLGTTDWTFEVSAAGEPRFTLPLRSLSDKPGENLVHPPQPAQATSELSLPTNTQLRIEVKGWKRGFLAGSKAEVAGSGWISARDGKASVHVAGAKPASPAFTAYFVLVPGS